MDLEMCSASVCLFEPDVMCVEVQADCFLSSARGIKSEIAHIMRAVVILPPHCLLFYEIGVFAYCICLHACVLVCMLLCAQACELAFDPKDLMGVKKCEAFVERQFTFKRIVRITLF